MRSPHLHRTRQRSSSTLKSHASLRDVMLAVSPRNLLALPALSMMDESGTINPAALNASCESILHPRQSHNHSTNAHWQQRADTTPFVANTIAPDLLSQSPRGIKRSRSDEADLQGLLPYGVSASCLTKPQTNNTHRRPQVKQTNQTLRHQRRS